MTIPAAGGVYALVILVEGGTSSRVGKLGLRRFAPGAYVYVGSSMTSLRPRILRHFSERKKFHWHIDYLLANRKAVLSRVGWILSRGRIECQLSRQIRSRSLQSMPGFGCGDCTCLSHLHYFQGLRMAYDALAKSGLNNCSLTLGE